MTIKSIRNDADLAKAFEQLEPIFGAAIGTPEADEAEVLVVLIEAYENKHYPIRTPTALEALQYAMEQRGLE